MTQVKMIVLLAVCSITMNGWAAPAPAVTAEDSPAPAPWFVEEGFFFNGVEGMLVQDGNSDLWRFAPDENVFITDERNYPAGKALPMLPCSVLEQMTQVAGTEKKLSIRLWALFTEYNQVNYLFGVYFMPVAEAPVQTETPTDDTQTGTEEPVVEPRGDSIIPEHILKQIKSNKTPDLKKFQQISKVSGDLNLIGRSGHLHFRNDQRVFQPDGFGLKVDSTEFILLPNHMRGTAEMQMMTTPGRDRYNVSGLVTKYKGKTYMLLRRATPTFSHGNFSD